ncbi:hypothetical protein GCM10009544_15690 [Streptomyces stramineus]|uniref:Uncharacterized protein n=1 Tax=Streptomyces stramineus TaxID=173861 RepID=A0ABN0ZNH1_9ACTN
MHQLPQPGLLPSVRRIPTPGPRRDPAGYPTAAEGVMSTASQWIGWAIFGLIGTTIALLAGLPARTDTDPDHPEHRRPE